MSATASESCPDFPASEHMEIAESYRGRGDPDSATALHALGNEAAPYDLSALEGLAGAHTDRSNHDEHRGLIRELAARGRAMLPKDLAWERGLLPRHTIKNRPLRHACQMVAIWAEEDDDQYASLRRVSDKTGSDAGLIRAHPLLHTTPDGDATQAAVQEGVDHNPLVASQIMHGSRPLILTEGFNTMEALATPSGTGVTTTPLSSEKERLMTAIPNSRQRSSRMRKARASWPALHIPGRSPRNSNATDEC